MITLMRNETDCEIAAISTATGISYEDVQSAFPVGELGPLTNPVRGNPEMSYLALARLGKWKRNITWGDLASRRATPGKAVILVHALDNPTLQQHWVVLAGYYDEGFLCYWGDSETPRRVNIMTMKDLFLGGWPNCAYEVIQDTWWNRLMRWLGFAMVLIATCSTAWAGGPAPAYMSGDGSSSGPGPGFVVGPRVAARDASLIQYRSIPVDNSSPVVQELLRCPNSRAGKPRYRVDSGGIVPTSDVLDIAIPPGFSGINTDGTLIPGCQP